MFGPDVSPPQVIAHRGASRQRLENTVEAFRRAQELGADAVELDVRRSADGVLVVHHDPAGPDGAAICDTLSRDLAPHIPTLERALDACRGLWVNVEVKNDPGEPDFDPSDSIARETAALLAARPEPADRWLVSSFRRRSVDAVREVAPAIATAWLCIELDPDLLPGLAADGHAAVHPWVAMLTDDLIAASQAAGLMVNTWTCDDPDRMAQLVAAGVNGLCTNVPDLGRQVVDGGTTRRKMSGS